MLLPRNVGGTALLGEGEMLDHGSACPVSIPSLDELEDTAVVQKEQVVIFLPLLWVATLYFHGWIPAALGLVWCIGRVVYAIGYMKEANKRGPGFGIAALASLALLVLSIWGVAVSWMAATAV